MRPLTLALMLAFLLSAAAAVAADGSATLAGVPVLTGAPATSSEFIRLMSQHPSMAGFARDGEVITGGVQVIALGEKLPLGPAPHTPWAKPLAGGPLRVIMISTTANNFDMAEVERRLDCQVLHIHLPDQYYAARQHPAAVQGYFSERALETLRKDADVILADPVVRVLSPEVAEAILRKVQGGCGLVWLPVARWGGGGQFGYWPTAPEMAPAWQELAAAIIKSAEGGSGKHSYLDQHQVTSAEGFFDGIPWELLPAHYLVPMEPTPEATVLAQDGNVPLAIGGPVGQGRAVALTWGSYMGCFPLQEDNKPPKISQYQEYYASAIIRALLWAAQRPCPVTFTGTVPRVAAGAPVNLRLSLRGVAAGEAKAELRLRDLLCREVWKGTVPGKAELEVKLPALAAGQYLLDAIARDGKGASLGWGTFVVTAEAQGLLGVSLDREAYDPGQPVRIVAQVGEVPEGEYTATLQVWDSLDRLLMENTKPLPAGKAEWTFPNRDPLCVLHYAEVMVKRNDAPYLASRVDVFVPRYDFPDFRNCLWGAWLPPYATARIDRRLREGMGFDIMLCGGYGGTHTVGNYQHLVSGCIPFYTNTAYLSSQAVETNPGKTKEDTLKMLEGSLPEFKQFGGAVIFFQDERHGMSDAGTVTPEAVAAFRAWLRGRYPSIQALNAAWGRDYADFDEVMPLLTKEFDPRQEQSLAPWLEWRLWVMDAVVDIDRTSVKRIHEYLGREVWTGLEGIFGLAEHNIPYGGLDLAAQAEDCFNAAAPYGENLMNACQSFYPGPSFAWGGYSMTYAGYQRYVWARALQGDWSLGWFTGRTYYTPYDNFLPQARWVADLTKPLREGVGKLLVENRPIVREPIAFLYSQPSLYSMAILGKTVDPTNQHLFVRPADWARDSLQRMITDSGLQYSYISEKQLQRGQAQGLKVLILSSCVALEPETCRALEKFVSEGGIVVADLCPGVWDHHGAYHSPGQLDALFGVTRAERFTFDTMPLDWGVGVFEAEPDFNIVGDWLIGQYYEKTLQVTDGHALGKHIFGPVQPPAFVFKRTGKGVTILMNYLETEYRRVPEHWQQMFATALFKLAGISAPVILRDLARERDPITKGLKVTRWQDGEAQYVGILLDEGKNTEIELTSGGYLYELAQGLGYLGQGTKAALDLRDKPYALLAVMPYKIEGVSLRAGEARLGQDLPLEFSVKIGGGPPVKHVVHLDVYRPDGGYYYSLSRNFVFKGGQWRGALPLALNDAPGRWTIKAREVVSGLSAEVRVEVRK